MEAVQVSVPEAVPESEVAALDQVTEATPVSSEAVPATVMGVVLAR
jgi:hypothetical protein